MSTAPPKDFSLETARLSLIPFGNEDFALLHSLNTDSFIRKYLWDDEIISEDVTRSILSQNQQHFIEDGFGLWKIVLKESQVIIGYIGLWFFFEEPQPQLIYALLNKFTKLGYASEASQAVIEYAFNTLGFEYLIAATDEPYMESRKVAQRVGMEFIETRMENDKPTSFFRIANPSRN